MRPPSPRLLSISLLLATVGCGHGKLAQGPHTTLEAYAAAVNKNDPRAGYALLSKRVQKRVSAEAFTERWNELRAELRRQAEQLVADERQSTLVTARVNYAGGSHARLRYEQGQWRLDDSITVSQDASTPADAVRALVGALEQRTWDAVARVLAKDLRQRHEGELERRLTKLKEWLAGEAEVEITGDKARIQYTPRLRIELVNEGGQWRVADFN